MKKPLVDQPTKVPTRKMMVFAITGIATAFVLQSTEQMAAQSELFSFLTGEMVQTNLPVVVGFMVAYWFRERET